MTRKALIGDALAALSLSSLWFLRQFHLAIFSADFSHIGRVPPQPIEIVGLLVAVSVLAAIYFLLFRAISLTKNIWLGRGLRLAVMLLGLAAFAAPSSEAITWFYPDAVSYLHLPLPFAVFIGCAAFAYSKKFSLTAIVINLRRLALFAAPLGLMLCAEGAIVSLGPALPPPLSSSIERPTVKSADSRVKNRVIWIIFDEMGRAPMMSRPDSVKMPAIDRLMSESFVAENAFPPNYFTKYSVMSMLTGRPLSSTVPASENDVKLNGTGSEPTQLLSQTETLVSDTKKLGGNVAIIGWWIPYTNYFRKELSIGYTPPPRPSCSQIADCSLEKIVDSLAGLPYFGRLMLANPSFDVDRSTTEQLEANAFLRDRASELAPDANIDLCYFHFPIPHWPFITKTDEPAKRGFYDSLEAVDRSFGELRAKLESAGQWNATTVIVSADHWWRVTTRGDFAQLPESERSAAVADRRVPFIVKLPGQNSAVAYSPAFNTVITRFLIDAVMTGEVNTGAELTKWLDKMAVERPDLVNFRPVER